ncbi:MAG: ACP S-malonyltransferase [Acidimicrobiia bacterium]|nr:ACP S-malonyltransferase [Acidimicrobiia bacterium]
MSGVAVLFPGQGSQEVGMGADLFERHVDVLGTESARILGWSLRDVCLDGPLDRLTRTEHAQPALFALSYARWLDVADVLEGRVRGAAGHSLGEYTALAAAGMIDYPTALAVVAERGASMAEAADAEPSGMAALIGATPESAEQIATGRRSDGGRLSVANINAPGQVVVAGGAEDLDWLEANARELGVRRAIRLNVAGAFHSPFMEPATQRLRESLAGLNVSDGRFEVWSNVTAAPVAAPDVVELLGRQVVSPVLFRQTLENMSAVGIDTFIHIGPGDVTAGMAKRTVEDPTVLIVNDADSVERLPSLLPE